MVTTNTSGKQGQCYKALGFKQKVGWFSEGFWLSERELKKREIYIFLDKNLKKKWNLEICEKISNVFCLESTLNF